MSKIKIGITKIAIIVFRAVLNVVYCVLKAFPTKNNKVVFCSRQSDDIPLDFSMIQEVLLKDNPDVKIINVCCRIKKSIGSYILFFIKMLKSMYHLATSKVCVIDAYWPAVSLLNHKKSLKVIQLWHSIGKMKKSGYQSLDKKSGRNKDLSNLLRMHKNYNYIIGGAPFWNPFYTEAFNISEDKILNYGLPRIDYLINSEQRNKERFLKEYPQFAGKTIILYAPTFRRGMKSAWSEIFDADIADNQVIIVKNHPSQVWSKRDEVEHIAYMDDWSTLDMLCVCHFVITDYSSIALEAAVLKKKTFFWTYDYDEYMQNSGININLREEAGSNLSESIDKILKDIRENNYDAELQKKYIEKFLPDEMGNSTVKIARFIESLMT